MPDVVTTPPLVPPGCPCYGGDPSRASSCTLHSAMRWKPGEDVLRFNTFTPPYVRAGTR